MQNNNTQTQTSSSRRPDIRAAMKTYKRNENINAHSENLVLLANLFGTTEQKATANEMVRLRDRQGYLTMEQSREGYKIHETLYPVFIKFYKGCQL